MYDLCNLIAFFIISSACRTKSHRAARVAPLGPRSISDRDAYHSNLCSMTITYFRCRQACLDMEISFSNVMGCNPVVARRGYIPSCLCCAWNLGKKFDPLRHRLPLERRRRLTVFDVAESDVRAKSLACCNILGMLSKVIARLVHGHVSTS
jgi:hypothetical protein